MCNSRHNGAIVIIVIAEVGRYRLSNICSSTVLAKVVDRRHIGTIGSQWQSSASVVVLVISFLTDSVSVSVKKDYLGSSTVQASDGDIRSVIVRWIGWQIYTFSMYIRREVGRHTRLIGRYTRFLVSWQVRTVRKRFGKEKGIKEETQKKTWGCLRQYRE